MRMSQLAGRSRLSSLLEMNQESARTMSGLSHRFARLSNNDSKPMVVSSFNLFQTPEAVAARMASLLDAPGSILEPSAGLGRLTNAARAAFPGASITAIDISQDCCDVLRKQGAANVTCGDFLEAQALNLFDAVIMNPPFKNGTDIKHILHALKFLKPGGKLVALCANGPRQNAKLKLLASSWEVLPEGSFKSEGTAVSVALLTISKEL